MTSVVAAKTFTPSTAREAKKDMLLEAARAYAAKADDGFGGRELRELGAAAVEWARAERAAARGSEAKARAEAPTSARLAFDPDRKSFWSWEVIGHPPVGGKRGYVRVRCIYGLCEGTEKTYLLSYLQGGHSQRCAICAREAARRSGFTTAGKSNFPTPREAPKAKAIGEWYEQWEVRGAPFRTASGMLVVPCRCACGALKDKRLCDLAHGRASSCQACMRKRNSPFRRRDDGAVGGAP